MNKIAPAVVLATSLALAGCAGTLHRDEGSMFDIQRSSEHRGNDDLLTAGLGAEGLRRMVPPAFADSARPTPQELRRRAIWSSWRGIADLAPSGGFGEVYGSLAAVPGREYDTLATVAGARHPQRVLAQVPDAFDHGKRCLVVTVASGSRGVYGAMAVGAAWGLPRGCAVVHSDKAAGSDYFDLDAGLGFDADGQVAPAGLATAFTPGTVEGQGVAFKHAHSQDNPEADWGRHTRQAAEFGLQALNTAFPEAAPFDFANTRVIAVGISNGGGAVLRAAELDGDWLDGVVAGEPNVHVGSHGGRSLYHYASEAALLMPCALPALGLPPVAHAEAMCNVLAERGRIHGADLAARQQSALEAMRSSGWSDAALRGGASSVQFDLWRAVLAAYASAYTRAPHDAHPCGYTYRAGEPGKPRAASAGERAAWWSDASGVPPGSGVQLLDPPGGMIEGLSCLAGLGLGHGPVHVLDGIAETRALPPRPGLPVIVVHGVDDGLIPMAFSSLPYVAAARAAGRGDVRLWQVHKAQHFDAFLAFPPMAEAYVPLLPYVYAALDRLEAHLDGKAGLPEDAVIRPTPRGVRALQAADLGLP